MIGDVIAAALPELRAQVESLMTDTCIIDRPGEPVWDEVEQKSVTPYTPVHADVPCTLLPPNATDRALVTGDSTTRETRTIRIPLGLDGIEPDDRVTVAGVGVLWVNHVSYRTHATSGRLECRWSR